MELSLAARKQITKAQLDRWSKATRAEKSAILDAVCAVTGWHRDHARKAIRRALAERANGGPRPRQGRDPVRTYGEEAVELLARCWAVLDGPTGKRLKPALPVVLANLERHGHLAGVDPGVLAQVLAMSPATIDRRLAGARTGAGGPQADRAYPAGLDAQSVDPDEDLGGVERLRARVRADRPGRPRGRGQQRRVLLHPGCHRRGHRLDRGGHGAVQGRADRRRRPGTVVAAVSVPHRRDPLGQRLGGRIQLVVATP